MRAFVALLALVALLPAPAFADPCETEGGMFQGPIALGYEAGDLGVARRACPRTEVEAAAGGAAVIEVQNFYGWLHGGLRLGGSWAFDADTEAFANLELLRMDYVQSSLSATSLGIGFGSVGVTRRQWHDARSSVAVSGRLVLPTALGLYQNAIPFGLDVGLNGLWRLSPSWEAYAHAGALTSFALSDAPGWRLGEVVTGGAAWRALPWLAFAGEVHAGFGEAAPLDVVDAALAARLAFGDAGLQLAVRTPLLGRERSLAAFEFAFDWRF